MPIVRSASYYEPTKNLGSQKQQTSQPVFENHQGRSKANSASWFRNSPDVVPRGNEKSVDIRRSRPSENRKASMAQAHMPAVRR